jgi:hypothetical protein
MSYCSTVIHKACLPNGTATNQHSILNYSKREKEQKKAGIPEEHGTMLLLFIALCYQKKQN